jgi:hypothetical protein
MARTTRKTTAVRPGVYDATQIMALKREFAKYSADGDHERADLVAEQLRIAGAAVVETGDAEPAGIETA